MEPLIESDASLEALSRDLKEATSRGNSVLTEVLDRLKLHQPPELDDAPRQDEKNFELDFLEDSSNPDSLGRLGAYEIREVIGRGGMGLVLRGHDTKLNRVVAIKVLAPQLAASASARRRFLREARAAAAVNHLHVVAIFAIEEEKLPYLVMEYVNGESLQQKIDGEGPLELKEILRIGVQIAAGLAAAHQQGLIHRDVKPSNVLLENGVERVKLTDFGLARAVDDISVTRTGEVAGTPEYMSPEQADAGTVDQRSDLFSLGSVLYAMGTGRSPFRAESTMRAMRRVCEDRPRPVREVNPDVPTWLADIIDKLLEKDPSKRIQTAAEVEKLLGSYLAHVQDPSGTSLPQPIFSRKPERRSRRWLILTATILVLAGGLGLSEATGVTHLAATVIRIATGEGTLVIKVDDPTVQISLDGEVLSITGAGIEQLRLRPGQYQFRATKDGKPVKQELVRITRGGREVVQVEFTRLDAPAISSVARIWDKAPHNGFTDLIRFEEHWFCVFREGTTYNSKDGAVRVISSSEGKQWHSAARLCFEGGGLRDPKITVTPDGRLMISAVAAFPPSAEISHQSLVWFSKDGRQWSDAVKIGDPDFWIWRITWCRGVAYGIGYATGERKGARLYRSEDGHTFDVLVENLFGYGRPSESSLVFVEDDTCLCLLREDTELGGARLGTARPPYRKWSWRELGGIRIGGPRMIRLPDGRLLVAGRDGWRQAAKTRLWRLNAQKFLLEPMLTLPSGGDTGYPGMVWHDGALWISYFSTHEAKASIYLAKVKVFESGRELAKVNKESLAGIARRDGKLIDYRSFPEDAIARVRRLAGHTSKITDIAVLGDRRLCLTASHDGTVRLWEIPTSKLLRTFRLDTYWADPLAVAPAMHFRQPLVIRAADVFRPVIQANPKITLSEDLPLLQAHELLVLEGLDVRTSPGQSVWAGRGSGCTRLLKTSGGIRAANCRLFFCPDVTGGTLAAWSDADLRNCLLIGKGAVCWFVISEGRLGFQNCIFVGGLYPSFDAGSDATFQLVGNTVLRADQNHGLLNPILRDPCQGVLDTAPPDRLQVFASSNILDWSTAALQFRLKPAPEPSLDVAELEELLPRLVDWRGERNLFRRGRALLGFS
jgi:serine/threonine protein kinase